LLLKQKFVFIARSLLFYAQAILKSVNPITFKEQV